MAVDNVSECLVRLALDADFSRRFTNGSAEERRTLLITEFPGMSTDLVNAFVSKNSNAVAEFIFNQQTSIGDSRSIAGALRVLLAAVESGKKQI